MCYGGQATQATARMTHIFITIFIFITILIMMAVKVMTVKVAVQKMMMTTKSTVRRRRRKVCVPYVITPLVLARVPIVLAVFSL